MRSSGEAEGPPRSVDTTHLSRAPPTIVRPRAHGFHLRRTRPFASNPSGNPTAKAGSAPSTAARMTAGISTWFNQRGISTAADTPTTATGTHHSALGVNVARKSVRQRLQWCVGPRKLKMLCRDSTGDSPHSGQRRDRTLEVSTRGLTVKLRGRPEAPDQATTVHGRLQRLLVVIHESRNSLPWQIPIHDTRRVQPQPLGFRREPLGSKPEIQ